MVCECSGGVLERGERGGVLGEQGGLSKFCCSTMCEQSWALLVDRKKKMLAQFPRRCRWLGMQKIEETCCGDGLGQGELFWKCRRGSGEQRS